MSEQLVKLMRRRAVEAATGLSRSSIYEKIAEGSFPKPVNLGPKSVAWIESEVNGWTRARIAARDAKATVAA